MEHISKNQLLDKIKEHVGMRNIVPTLPNAHRTAGCIEIINKLVLNVLSELHWPVRELELALGIPRGWNSKVW